MENTSTEVQSSPSYEIHDILCSASVDTTYKLSRATITCGLVRNDTNEFVLPRQNLIQYKLLYKTNADCNNYWHEVFGDNKPLKEDPFGWHFDGVKFNKEYDESSPRVAFAVSIPPGQIATFRMLARVFQPGSGSQSNVFVSALPTELLHSIFSYLSFDECREYASSVCKAWRSAIYGYAVTLPGVVYAEPKEVSCRAADESTDCWCIKIHETPSAIPQDHDPVSRFLQWQSSKLNSADHIYASFVKADKDIAAAMNRVAAIYKLYANSFLLGQDRATHVPVDVREKLFQCGVPSAVTFYFCKPIASNSIVLSIITVKRRHIQPIEVIPTDKFSKLFTTLEQLWPSIKPHEMKFKLRHNGKRLDVSHSDQSFAQLGITNFSWLHLDMSHPDVIPINVYQIDNKVITITIKSTMTRKSFREKVHQVTGTDSSKSYIVNLEGNDDEPIGQTYSKENHLFKENICFVFENAKATRPFEYLPIGSTWGRQVEFDIDVAADIFHKYLIALGVCGVNNRLRKRGGRYFDMAQSLRENGIAGQFDRVDILL
eukprot:TRINITY_DN430_c0_g1_i2.p1 TRINITY_DN430_c0_g1~~TRINITY_DN430_c0_g1_i2.p1  ORF type:complete len:544 (+),score=69.82 TRINITY_DN430_c0_g1_i2:476-2107(+)